MLSLPFRFSLDRTLASAVLVACAPTCPAGAQARAQGNPTPARLATSGVMAGARARLAAAH
jgi:hypothetical protein